MHTLKCAYFESDPNQSYKDMCVFFVCLINIFVISERNMAQLNPHSSNILVGFWKVGSTRYISISIISEFSLSIF